MVEPLGGSLETTQWAQVTFSHSLDSVTIGYSWFADVGQSYCDAALTEPCINYDEDENGVGSLSRITDMKWAGVFNEAVDGYWGYVYNVNSWFHADALYIDYSYTGDTPVRYTVAFASSAAAIPEPATWLMVVLGFALVGCALRRSPSRGSLPNERSGNPRRNRTGEHHNERGLMHSL
jgi:hypothetical protein